MDRNAIINQLKPRFQNDMEWNDFLAYIENRKVRGDADEMWLQWEIHLLSRQDSLGSWHSHGSRFLSESFRLSDAPII
jgi:hypothetical protein